MEATSYLSDAVNMHYFRAMARGNLGRALASSAARSRLRCELALQDLVVIQVGGPILLRGLGIGPVLSPARRFQIYDLDLPDRMVRPEENRVPSNNHQDFPLCSTSFFQSCKSTHFEGVRS